MVMGVEVGSLWRVILVLMLYFDIVSMAMKDCELNPLDPNKVAYTINVDNNGNHDFTSIQQAIDSIPSGNNRWIRIFIFQGTYIEKVVIPKDKGCIFMEGETAGSTIVSWGDHVKTDTSATFTARSDNLLVKALSFKNTYMISGNPGGVLNPALAVSLHGDKYAFYNCEFVGLQDTIWDAEGRHYFKHSSISGVIDFIWGRGQSIYEECQLSVSLEGLGPHRKYGIITAQGRESESDMSGFVFKGCTITGTGKTLLGRAYREYSRVIFYRCEFPDTVLPVGWDAWNAKGNENKVTYVEAENKGGGANTIGRVGWLKKMSEDELNHFITLSYIDSEGWISNLPSPSQNPQQTLDMTNWISRASGPNIWSSPFYFLFFLFIFCVNFIFSLLVLF